MISSSCYTLSPVVHGKEGTEVHTVVVGREDPQVILVYLVVTGVVVGVVQVGTQFVYTLVKITSFFFYFLV